MKRTTVLAAAWLLLGCGAAASDADRERGNGARVSEPPAGALVFVNRIYVVEASNRVPVGSFYVFLADGMLVVTEPGSRPALGRWSFERGELNLIEESISRPVEIVEARGDRLRLLVRGPGEPVSLDLRDARPGWIDR